MWEGPAYLGRMESQVSAELVASGVLLAAAILFCFRMAFTFWAKGKTFLALLLGVPAGLYGFGLLYSAFI
jgi:hypothetical protein